MCKKKAAVDTHFVRKIYFLFCFFLFMSIFIFILSLYLIFKSHFIRFYLLSFYYYSQTQIHSISNQKSFGPKSKNPPLTLKPTLYPGFSSPFSPCLSSVSIQTIQAQVHPTIACPYQGKSHLLISYSNHSPQIPWSHNKLAPTHALDPEPIA